MSRIGTLGSRLYRGEVDVDFVGRHKLWYGLSALLLVFSIAGLFVIVRRAKGEAVEVNHIYA